MMEIYITYLLESVAPLELFLISMGLVWRVLSVDRLINGECWSIAKHNLRYKECIRDSDTSSFSVVFEWKPYQDIEITYPECIGHVLKRSGTVKMESKKQAYEKYISGKSRLIEKTMFYKTIMD